MMEIVKTFFDLLTPRERRNLYLLFCAVLVMAGLEVVSVGSIMPFLQVAADPASVHENAYLSWAYETFGFADTNSFLILLGLGALAALVLSNAFIVFTTWAVQRYVWGRNHSLSCRLLRSYLWRPYEYFLTRNSAELGKNVLDEVKEVANNLLRPALRGTAKSAVALAIISFLVFVDPVITLLVTTVLGGSYTLVYYMVRDWLDVAGTKRVNVNNKRYQYVDEAFRGIKQVKLRGKENVFVNQYSSPSEQYASVQAWYRVINRAPRYILEAIAFGGVIIIAVYLIAVRDDIRQVIPMLGLYAFAGYRLMPALQQAFMGITSTLYNVAALEAVHSELDRNKNNQRNSSDTSLLSEKVIENKERPLALNNRIVLNDICYTYPGSKKMAIQHLSLEIPAHTTTGFVGKTGSGKTTVVDIILGLLFPQQGTVVVDGTVVQDYHIRRWRQCIGYVPQKIYLSDSTIARNIAFGVPEDEIDMSAVEKAARSAQILEFIEKDLPCSWKTVVGEDGVKLSGGQRQRIGIARALYHQPTVLVFDEATSDLDQKTELDVMRSIYNLEEEHTIIIVAHRLSTVKDVDNVIMLKNGKKVGEGKYKELLQDSSEFRKMRVQ
jgi:ATP-binding cassette subfamily C protein